MMASVEGDPPAGYSIRPVSLDDAETITGLINACTVAELGVPWASVEDTRDDLTAPGRDIAADEVIVSDAGGVPAGYLQVWGDIAPFTDLALGIYVHPEHWGRGVSTFLIRLGEERARGKIPMAPEGERVTLQVARFADNERAATVFGQLGFAYVRTFWMMRIELADPPPAPDVPSGITIRRFDLGSDVLAVHAALEEAFEDHWGDVFLSFERWRHRFIDGAGAGFDPGLWFVAVDGDEVVGAACCRAGTARDPDVGEVDELGVRRAWRGRGVGRALLLSAFGEFHRRGISGVELGVDAASPTGATRLYERAGMHVAYRWEFWEKELRPARA
jgi:mycothiol synthase